MKAYADNIFTFGVGILLIFAANTNTEIWTIAHGGISALVIIGAILSIISFGGFGVFWVSALKRLDVFGPNCDGHDFAMATFEESVASVEPYKNPSALFFSFTGSVILMAGLLLQGWYIALGFEVLGSAIGYGFIHYFQINRHIILGQITGADEATE